MKIILLKEGIHKDIEPRSPKMDNEVSEICSSVVLLKAENDDEENIIVDTGNWGYEKEILNALKNTGVKPEDIKWIVNTHNHFDHISNMYLFKKAKRVSKTGVWFPEKNGYYYKDASVLKEVHGIEIIPTPGHTPDHRSIMVKSDGKKYIIAGDAINEKYMKENIFGVMDNPNYIQSAEKIVNMADIIIPGHGRMMQGKDLEQLRMIISKWRNNHGKTDTK